MAGERDAASRTEEATPRRLEEARKEGDVPKSAELAQAFALAGAFAAVAIGGGWLSRNLAQGLTPFLAHPDTMQLKGQAGVGLAWQVMLAAAPAMAAVLGATVLAGVAGNVVQHGFLFTTAKLRPDPSRLSPAAGFQRLFGVDNFMSFLRSLLKVLLVGALAWWVLAPHARELPGLVGQGAMGALAYCADLSRSLMLAVIALLALGGLLDFLWQRQRFLTKMRMTKEELKEDYRQSEGDPRVKARQRQIRLERARRRMIQAVPKATVVVANPTHFAVALRYEQGLTPAPECVAKGADAIALKIREVAEAHGVPVVEDPPLARALYGAVEVDQIIPQQHYEAVAKIIGFIFAGRRPGRVRPARPQTAIIGA
ncbi:MAG: flagellar biosynthesis protein FlhB [Caulobacteraceae bacterium]|nr:flagellar biosynthesis protein FlhB [Caulobacteraceae bacterium]